MTEYHLKPGRLGKKVMDAYQKTEQAFTETFLEKDPGSPSGYSLKTGEAARQAVNTYNKIESGVVETYKKVERAFVDAFLEKMDGQSGPKADQYNT